MDKPGLIVTLAAPIAHAGGEILDIKLREPTVAEMRDAERKLTDYTPEVITDYQVALVMTVSGLEEAAINVLPVSAMRKANTYLFAFGVRPKNDVDPAEELDLDLPEAIVSSGITYATLELTEPTVGMRRRAITALRSGNTPGNLRQYDIILTAEASGVPFAVIEQVPVSIVNRAAAYLQGFMQGGPETGSA